MKWYSVWVHLVAFVISIAVSPNVSGDVYKCVDNLGKTAYQAKPCDNSAKSDQIGLKKFNKPTTVKVDKPETKESSSGESTQISPQKEKKRI